MARVAPGRKQQEEGMGSIRDEIRKRLALAEKGDLEQLLKGAIEDQETQKQLERRSEGPGETDTESDRLLTAAQAADRGPLRTAARLLGGSKLLPPTEATADAIEQLYQTGGEAQKRTDGAFDETTHSLKSDVRQQHVLTHIRDAKRQAHPGGKARPTAFEEVLLNMVTSSILRAHISQVRRAAGAYQFGTYHEGGAPEIAWKIHAKMAAEPTENGFGAARRRDAIEGAKRWFLVLGTVFANLFAGKPGVQPTAWANTPRGSRPITVRDGLLQSAC